MQYEYKTKGTCSQRIFFEIEDGILKEVSYLGGCNGNLKGISSLVAGMKVEDVIARLDGITCGGKPTSCPDQLAKALKEALKKGDSVLLEPMMKVTVITPEDYMGDVIGDLNSRRGQIQGMEARNGSQEIRAFVPLAEMFGYATDLRSKTQGRGQYTMEPSHYVEVPKSIGEKIIASRSKND